MRKLIAGGFVSLDGVMQAPGGPEEDPSGGFEHGGWLWPHWDETLDTFLSGIFDKGDYDLLLGRTTYDIFAGYWPDHTEDAIGQAFSRIRKYVVTSRPDTLTWEGSEALVGDPAESVARLKQGNGPNLLIQGSRTLYPALLGARLIDRLYLVTAPIVLGKGKRLFGDSSARTGLRLVEQHTSATGVVITVYDQAGAVETGSVPEG